VKTCKTEIPRVRGAFVAATLVALPSWWLHWHLAEDVAGTDYHGGADRDRVFGDRVVSARRPASGAPVRADRIVITQALDHKPALCTWRAS
jgi:hypothetical protein